MYKHPAVLVGVECQCVLMRNYRNVILSFKPGKNIRKMIFLFSQWHGRLGRKIRAFPTGVKPFHPIPSHHIPLHSILFCSTLTSWISRASPWSISSTLKNHTNQIFLWYIQLHEDFLLQAIISPRDPFRRWCLKQVQSNLSLRTPLYYGQFVWSQKCQKSYITYLYNTDTSVTRTLGSAPLVSVLRRFDCTDIHR